MRKPGPFAAAAVAFAFFLQGCVGLHQVEIPEPDLRDALQVRGVVLREEGGSKLVEFSEVHASRWTNDELVISGVLHAPGEAEDGQESTQSFPIGEIERVVVRQVDGNRTSVVIGGLIMGVVVVATFLITGKSQDGVPIG